MGNYSALEIQKTTRPFHWWHAVLFWALVNAPGAFIGWREELFPGYLEPPLRPPGFVFPFVWLLINVCMLAAGLRILNRSDMVRRHVHIALQTAFWISFALFPYFYFAKSSSIIGGALTLLIFAVAAAEARMLWRDDRISGVLMLPLFVWGGFAGLYLSVWQAMFNPDPYLGLSAPLG
jgi:translocator protein